MRRNRILLIGVLAVIVFLPTALFLWFAYGPAMVEYQPVVMDEDQRLVVSPSLATPEHLDRLERVLTSYNEAYRRDSRTKLLIERKLSRDTDLLWNYTTKAEANEMATLPD